MILYDHNGFKIAEGCIIRCSTSYNNDYHIKQITHFFIHNRYESSSITGLPMINPNQYKCLLYIPEKGLRDQCNHIWEVASDENGTPV